MKHPINRGIVFIALLLSFLQIQAQNDALNFTMDSDMVNIAGHETAIKSTIEVSEKNILWTQYANGSKNATMFNITSSAGNWDQDASLGSVVYSLSMDDYMGSITLLGQESGISATLTLTIPNFMNEEFIFNISNITYHQKP